MTTITGFKCIDENGFPILCDAHGNNAAIRCPGCSSPILIVARENQKGSDEAHTTQCISCGVVVWVSLENRKKRLIFHKKIK